MKGGMDLPDDPEALELLDGYLEQLQAGERPDRAALVARRPDLAVAVAMIEKLEGFAPASSAAAYPAVAKRPSNFDPTLDVWPEPDVLPRTFGQYELLSEIGRGGMGVVYKARQPTLDRIVAVKMILGHHLASAEHVRRFQIEARAAARLRHPNIVPIHEVGQLHGQHYFVMEHIDGESLAQRLSRGPLDLPAAVRLLTDVVRAVEHLHQQNIVHRDLKPSNILLDGEGRPYVTDFGLAKIFGAGTDATTTGVIAGTPSYMAPEQATAHTEIGPGADVYSLGAILYELLTGQPPFHSDNPLDTLMDVLGGEPERPRKLNPKVPLGLELICLKCLAKSPDDRYASAAALADDLQRFAGGEPLAVRPPTVVRRLWSWTRRQPALALRLGALSVFYAVEWFNYLNVAAGVTAEFHWRMSAIIFIWAAASILLQQFLGSYRWSVPARFVWGLLDGVSLLVVLLVADGVASPLLAAYPLLIVGSGLWFRVRFVWFTSVAALVSYGILVADFYLRRPYLGEHFDVGVDRHVIFALALVVEGAAVAYLVDRVRTLSTFYGRPLP